MLKLLADLCDASAAHHEEHVRGVKRRAHPSTTRSGSTFTRRLRTCPRRKRAPSDVATRWTWTVIDTDTKLMVSYMGRPQESAMVFELMNDAASRLAGKLPLTTDGLYCNWIELARL